MKDAYESPFGERYATKEMQYIFSQENKFRTWRRLWIALAETEKELGVEISNEQIEEMRRYESDINYDVAAAFEKKLKHDVMAHIHAFGEQAKKARPVIHLGATSCYVTDNADIIIMKAALSVIRGKLLTVMRNLTDFALKYKGLPTLGFTHFQPAQFTTVGKRASLWLYDVYLDFVEVKKREDGLKLRGAKGATGTQMSFLYLFDGDKDKVDELDKTVVKKMGFDEAFPVTGQTYTRKVDFYVLSALSGIAQSAHKFANDIRLLQNLKEIEEPFEKSQVGSSAMAYKRNPMRCERMTGLARYIMTAALNPAFTAAEQWLERTLDDSANRRVAVAEMFLAADGLLNVFIDVTDGLVVNKSVIERHVREEAPFAATEAILMECVKAGGDRQNLHEKIRAHCMAAAEEIKRRGTPNDLIERIKNDEAFAAVRGGIDDMIDAQAFTGRAEEQTERFAGFIRDTLLSGEGGRVKSELNV
ncbi:MAG: adenylosuccinate lyase [Clostridiales bacterium]|jgi:adenylosuccinate lyase|nr:adenylosuccinate lyase [Clostridiales bacterium]